MSLSNQLTNANLYNASGVRYEALTDETEDGSFEELDELRLVKLRSLRLGVSSGLFLQIATLCVHHWIRLAIDTDNDNHLGVATRWFLLWASFASAAATGVLLSYRSYIERSARGDSEVLVEVAEINFVMGAMSGIFTTWILTELVLGLSNCTMTSMLFIFVLSMDVLVRELKTTAERRIPEIRSTGGVQHAVQEV